MSQYTHHTNLGSPGPPPPAPQQQQEQHLVAATTAAAVAYQQQALPQQQQEYQQQQEERQQRELAAAAAVAAFQQQQFLQLPPPPLPCSPRFALGSPVLRNRSESSPDGPPAPSFWQQGEISSFNGQLYSVLYEDGEEEILNESEVMKGVYTFRKKAYEEEEEEEEEEEQQQQEEEEQEERATSSSSFTERIEQLLKRHAVREEAHQSEGPTLFIASELAELSLLCTQQATMTASSSPSTEEGFAGVEGDLLMSLALVLQKHVQEAETLDLFQEAATLYQQNGQSTGALQKWLMGDAEEQLQVLRFGLEAGNIIVQIAVTEGVDRRAVNEDALQATISLFRLHMRVHAVPTLNQTAHLSFQSPEEKQKSDSMASPSKKRRRSSSTPHDALDRLLAKELGKLYKFVGSTFKMFFVLMERMELLMNSMLLDDHQVLLITNAAIQAFEIDCQPSKQSFVSPGHQIQLASIAILSAAFRQYPNHRETILEEIWPILLRIPTAKRSLRIFRVRYTSASSTSLSRLNTSIMKKFCEQGDNHCIQMMTALFLNLVQACVVRPTYANKISEEDEESAGEPEYASGLVSCQRISALLVFQLLKRCKRSKYGGGSDEYRIFLSNMVQDLLSVLLVPEYPASEMLISSLLARLRQDIQQASSSSAKASHAAGTENSYLSVTLDILGKICAVEARLLKVHADGPIAIRTKRGKQGDDDNDDDIEVSCFCGIQDRDSFLLGCDSCKFFFHGKCVGQGSESVPDEWICDSCRLGRISKREQRLRECDEAFIDRPYVMRHAFLSSLAHRKGVENIETAVQFHFAQWLDDLHAKAFKKTTDKHTKTVLEELVNQWDSIEPNGEPLTDEGYNRTLLALFAECSPMALSFRNQLLFILKIMEDKRSPHLRKLSLKTIEKAAEGDDKLMLIPVITRTVSRRLADETISVREAALSFVGNYVISFPQIASAFQSSLIMCLSDAGISVRKRAVRIFQEVLLTNPHYRGRSEACDAMLRRAAYRKEEDTVRDLIYDLFTKLWLQDGEQIVAGPNPSPRKDPPLSSQAQTEAATSSIVTPTPGTPPRPRSRLKRVELAAEQMMEVVRASGTGDHLEKLLKQLYDAKLDVDRKRKGNPIEMCRQHLGLLVGASFDLLLSLEENRASGAASVGKDLAATLRTIEVLSGTAPSSTMKHLDTILPYLKADNGVSMEDESMIVSACCDILTRASSIFDRNDLNRFACTSVAGDLRQIVYKFGPDALNSAIRTLSALGHHPESNGQVGKDLLGLAQTFYAYLLRHKATADFSPGKVQEKIRCNLLRALAVLGSICLHRGRSTKTADDDQFEIPVGELPPSSSISWTNLTMSCYQVIAEYLKKKDPGTKCAALRALGSIFLSEPRLLFALEQVGLVDDIMSPKAPLPLQLEALECWKRILESEEKRIDAGHAKEKMDRDKSITVTKQISGDQDSDSNLFGGVLTSHADRLFEMVGSRDVELRLSSLELLGLLLRQGLVNPNDAVPHLLALQGDVENNSIRSLALEFLIAEGEKRPDMLRQRVRAGVKQACAFQRAVYPQKQHVAALIETESGIESVFDRVFKECIAPIRKQREGLFSSLLGLFELKELSQSPTGASTTRKTSPTRGRDGSTDLPLLVFVAQILAHLPYTTALDPLFIIHKIGSIAALQGYQILDNFAILLRPLRIDNSDEWDDTNEDEDPLEKSAKEKFPCRTKHARPLTDGNFDLMSFAKLCQRSGGFVLLMRLKTYLRHVYKLSEIRCFEFNPTEKEKVFDRGIFRIDKPPPFDSKLPVAEIANFSKQKLDVDALIRQYAEFRQSLRAEMASTAKAEEEKMEKEEKEGLKHKADDDPAVSMEESSDVEA
ncbi:hypothetical protein ACA910_018019 [Epithemia clementina (nom. ined.)]